MFEKKLVMNSLRVIISTHDTLQALGLRRMLSDVFGINAHIVAEEFFATIQINTEPELFFIDQTTMVANLSFFLPRKAKTIVLMSSDQVIEEFRTINSSAKEEEIITTLNTMLEAQNSSETISTKLSSRETEVLRLIASGAINKEIAQSLNISINTVLTHRKNITAKLGIKSVSGLTFYAMMNGIV